MTTRSPLTVAIAALTLTLAAAPAPAQWETFPQADSAATLRIAQGTLWDVSQVDPEPHWTFDGEWTFYCGGDPCAEAALADVGFDLVLNMVRPDGGLSHSHTFSDFQATAVTLDGDSLTVEGTIVGSGGIGGLSDVVVRFSQVGTEDRFTLELPGNEHILDILGGVVVRSR